jgi:hypothetical protein
VLTPFDQESREFFRWQNPFMSSEIQIFFISDMSTNWISYFPEIDLEEGGLNSLDIGGSAGLFSPAHMGPQHGVYSIDHDEIEDYYLSHRPERRNVYPLPSGRQPWLIPSLEPLIADVALAKSR